jgi:hypothetical protein
MQTLHHSVNLRVFIFVPLRSKDGAPKIHAAIETVENRPFHSNPLREGR